MTIKEQVISGIKMAMKERDKVRLNALRNISATFLEFEKEKSGNEITDNVALTILFKLEKKRKESIELYQKGNRPELAEQERQELVIIKEFLPQKLSIEEVTKEIQDIVDINGFTSKKELGQIMKIMMEKFTVRVDGNMVRQVAEQFLG
jgi:uncharacterized protein